MECDTQPSLIQVCFLTEKKEDRLTTPAWRCTSFSTTLLSQTKIVVLLTSAAGLAWWMTTLCQCEKFLIRISACERCCDTRIKSSNVFSPGITLTWLQRRLTSCTSPDGADCRQNDVRGTTPSFIFQLLCPCLTAPRPHMRVRQHCFKAFVPSSPEQLCQDSEKGKI